MTTKDMNGMVKPDLGIVKWRQAYRVRQMHLEQSWSVVLYDADIEPAVDHRRHIARIALPFSREAIRSNVHGPQQKPDIKWKPYGGYCRL